MNDWAKVAVAGTAALLSATAIVYAAGQQTIVQSGREFHPGEVTVSTGDTLVFTNQDEFIHQIYISSPTMTFDSDEKAPGETLPVRFPTAGTFDVRCHIHPKMHLVVHVK